MRIIPIEQLEHLLHAGKTIDYMGTEIPKSEYEALEEITSSIGLTPEDLEERIINDYEKHAGITIQDNHVTQLQIQYYELKTLPENIGQLTNLEKLHLYNNKLSALPETIRQLTNLKELRLWGNRLSTLPETIGGLTNLTILKLRE